MARGRKGLNRHQKAAFKGGEHRVRGETIQRLIELADSTDPAERLHAAANLCPCHVRKRVEAAGAALYRLMQDPDVRVRRAAWHTLEDGGCPNDPALLPIFERAVANETDSQVRGWVERFCSAGSGGARPARLAARGLHPFPRVRALRLLRRNRTAACVPNTIRKSPAAAARDASPRFVSSVMGRRHNFPPILRRGGVFLKPYSLAKSVPTRSKTASSRFAGRAEIKVACLARQSILLT